VTAKNSTYHHGDLKNALVETALRMLESEPLEALSLRKIAREVGVSPTAAYNHFANKEDLLASAKLEATKRFQHFAADALSSKDEPEDKIEAFSLGYFNFARQYPALFDIMLNCNVDVSRLVEEGFAAVFAMEHPLREAIVAVREKHGKPALSEYTLSVLHQYAWSLTHGVIIHYRSGNFKAMTASGLWPKPLSLDHMGHALALCKWYARLIADTVVNAEDLEPMEPVEDWLAARAELIAHGLSAPMSSREPSKESSQLSGQDSAEDTSCVASSESGAEVQGEAGDGTSALLAAQSHPTPTVATSAGQWTS
jgi:AcrR family transcriptional regulator